MLVRKIAVIGGGIGGLVAAIALRRNGVDVEVCEQAPKFRRIGAAINLTPNAVNILDRLGIGEAVRDTAFRPTHRVSRVWNTGEETSRLALDRVAEAQYGAPTLTTHRADLLSAIEAALPSDAVSLNKQLVRLAQTDDKVEIEFADGSRRLVDAVIGADGIHSTVRSLLYGPEAPRFAGAVAFRSIIPSSRVKHYELSCFTKWWGPNPESQLVTFLINKGRDLFIFASVPETEWQSESWSIEGEIEELRAGFVGYHAEARETIEACETALKTALYERDPLAHWTRGRVSLLGDACHPMMPFMAQGAAMGIEDAVVLTRCIEAGADDVPAALEQFERTRKPRTSRVQLASRENEWLRTGIDANWVYGYDAFTAELTPRPSAP